MKYLKRLEALEAATVKQLADEWFLALSDVHGWVYKNGTPDQHEQLSHSFTSGDADAWNEVIQACAVPAVMFERLHKADNALTPFAETAAFKAWLRGPKPTLPQAQPAGVTIAQPVQDLAGVRMWFIYAGAPYGVYQQFEGELPHSDAELKELFARYPLAGVRTYRFYELSEMHSRGADVLVHRVGDHLRGWNTHKREEREHLHATERE